MKLKDCILQLLFPSKCVFCRKLLRNDEQDLCFECRNTLWKEIGGYEFQKGSYFEKCVYALHYKGTVRSSILRYKFHGKFYYADSYGRILAECVNHHFAGRYDLITWVPISKMRYLRRGYDQAKLLAEKTAIVLDVPAERLLYKTRNNLIQSRIKDAGARRVNVLNVFRTERDKVQGKRILLIDDIVTTGATFSECARTLLMAGAEEVICAALAGHR